MSKGNRREAIALLLGGLGCLAGCETTLGLKKPSLPEECVWLTFPYSWHCFELPRWESGADQETDGESRAPEGEKSPDPTDRGEAPENPSVPHSLSSSTAWADMEALWTSSSDNR